WRFSYAGPGVRRTTFMGPASENLHNRRPRLLGRIHRRIAPTGHELGQIIGGHSVSVRHIAVSSAARHRCVDPLVDAKTWLLGLEHDHTVAEHHPHDEVTHVEPTV